MWEKNCWNFTNRKATNSCKVGGAEKWMRGGISKDKWWAKGVSISQLPESGIATECKIGTFSSLLQWETSLPKRCSGDKHCPYMGQCGLRNPGILCGTCGLRNPRKNRGAWASRFPSTDVEKLVTISKPRRGLSAWFAIKFKRWHNWVTPLCGGPCKG